MNLKAISSGICSTNSYLIEKDDGVYLIDAPDDNSRMLSLLKEKGKLTAVLLTHGHFDHIMGLKSILDEFPSTPVYLAEKDHYLIKDGEKGNLYFLRLFGIPLSLYDVPSDIVFNPYPGRIGSIEIIPTPGHTPGSVSLFIKDENVLFSGDTLFFHSEGRTDLGGDSSELFTSLRKLLTSLPSDTIVLPGHGGYTKIDEERQRLM